MLDNILHLYRDFYYRMPQGPKTFLGTLYGNVPLEVRFGKPYRLHKRLLHQFEAADEQFQLDFLFNKTLETLQFAERYIPFYQRWFAEHEFSTRNFSQLSDLCRAPSISKTEVREHSDEMFTSQVQRPATYFTSGSTSVPVKFYLPLLSSRGKEKAYMNHVMEKCGGYRYRDRTVLLKGREVARPEKGTFWEREPVDNYLIVSSNSLIDRNCKAILNAIERFGARYFFGYPSSVLGFIRMVQRSGIETIPEIEGVMLVSENLYDEEVSIMQDFFRCPVLLQYGHSERTCMGYRINARPYDVLNSYGACRIVDGEIVGTSFDNFVMPFINYRTNDFVEGVRDRYPGTDIARSVDDVVGRLQEFLVTSDGRLISVCTMGAGHFSALESVRGIQYRQTEPGKAQLLAEREPGREIDTDLIRQQLEKHTGDSIRFTVVPCDEVPKSGRGKRVMCVQELDIEKYR